MLSFVFKNKKNCLYLQRLQKKLVTVAAYGRGTGWVRAGEEGGFLPYPAVPVDS